MTETPLDATGTRLDRRRAAALAAVSCVAGAVLQLGYGVAAIAVGYPRITEPAFEAVWLLVNLGMAGGLAGWLLLDVAWPRRLALIAGGTAIAGQLLRVAVSIWLIADQSAAVDGPIVAGILLMFAGLGTLGVCTLRGPLTGWPSWAPLTTVAAGIVTAAWYSIDRPTHFVLLGLLWGTAWTAFALTLRRLTVVGHVHKP
ncbi:hypothetical protein AB0E69_31920 [Kribbella sp. NPDC026611]|uniref:hypothetical protein n=1 Tax=Kribbella sp. NPDC026611 TaxID=3154911 RepID=UPI0033CBDA55